MSVYIFGIFVLLTINKSGFKKPTQEWALPPDPAVHLGTCRAHPSPLATPVMTKLESRGWETSCGLGIGFSRSQRSGYISSPLTPNGTNLIAIRVLNKHILGVLLTSGDEPAAPGDLESSFFCAPY